MGEAHSTIFQTILAREVNDERTTYISENVDRASAAFSDRDGKFIIPTDNGYYRISPTKEAFVVERLYLNDRGLISSGYSIGGNTKATEFTNSIVAPNAEAVKGIINNSQFLPFEEMTNRERLASLVAKHLYQEVPLEKDLLSKHVALKGDMDELQSMVAYHRFHQTGLAESIELISEKEGRTGKEPDIYSTPDLAKSGLVAMKRTDDPIFVPMKDGYYKVKNTADSHEPWDEKEFAISKKSMTGEELAHFSRKTQRYLGNAYVSSVDHALSIMEKSEFVTWESVQKKASITPSQVFKEELDQVSKEEIISKEFNSLSDEEIAKLSKLLPRAVQMGEENPYHLTALSVININATSPSSYDSQFEGEKKTESGNIANRSELSQSLGYGKVPIYQAGLIASNRIAGYFQFDEQDSSDNEWVESGSIKGDAVAFRISIGSPDGAHKMTFDTLEGNYPIASETVASFKEAHPEFFGDEAQQQVLANVAPIVNIERQPSIPSDIVSSDASFRDYDKNATLQDGETTSEGSGDDEGTLEDDEEDAAIEGHDDEDGPRSPNSEEHLHVLSDLPQDVFTQTAVEHESENIENEILIDGLKETEHLDEKEHDLSPGAPFKTQAGALAVIPSPKLGAIELDEEDHKQMHWEDEVSKRPQVAPRISSSELESIVKDTPSMSNKFEQEKITLASYNGTVSFNVPNEEIVRDREPLRGRIITLTQSDSNELKADKALKQASRWDASVQNNSYEDWQSILIQKVRQTVVDLNRASAKTIGEAMQSDWEHFARIKEARPDEKYVSLESRELGTKQYGIVKGYPEGVKDGKWITTNAEGKIAQEAHFQDGKLHGVLRNYAENGKLLERQDYSEGSKHGLGFTYNMEGRAVHKTEHDHGVETLSEDLRSKRTGFSPQSMKLG